MSQFDTEKDKNPKIFPIFKGFMHFFHVFDRLSTGALKRVNDGNLGQMCCPVCLKKR